MRISDWSSDVCSSDLAFGILKVSHRRDIHQAPKAETVDAVSRLHTGTGFAFACGPAVEQSFEILAPLSKVCRSEEHTSELQSLMRISYAVFCLKKKTQRQI